MSTGYIDEYGRYRYSSVQNTKITVPTFQHWLDIFNNAAVSAATTTSAAPVTSGTPIEENERDSERQTNGGPDNDVADREAHRDTLPEYDNAKDWFSAMGRTPGILGPSMVIDAVVGRGLFDQNKDRSYNTVGDNKAVNAELDRENQAIEAARNSPEAQAERDSGQVGNSDSDRSAAAAADPAARDGAGAATGTDYAEGGEVMFNSAEDVPGEVTGPGGPKDDAVPANLSDGEYVNTAEAVQSFGQPFFDQVNQIAKLPGAPSLMTNPDFQKMQNEFLTNAAGIAQKPATGNVAPVNGTNTPSSGLMSPMESMPGMPEEQMPMGMAEGGLVPSPKGGGLVPSPKGGGLVPSPKGGGLMNPMEDFFEWLLEKFSRNRQQAKLSSPGGTGGATINGDPSLKGPPETKLIDDPASKAKNMGTAQEVKEPTLKGEKLSVGSTAKNAGLSLARRAIPGVGTAAAIMESSPTNEGEEEMMEEAMKDPQAAMGNVKESRTKGDTEMPFMTKEEMKSEKPSLVSKPNKVKSDTKTATKKKETPATENKLAPDASLGDALEFYKRQDAPGFVFKGETYERSARSPSGYTQV